MKKKLLIAVALALTLAAGAFAQSESDFNVELTADGTGAIITGYTGSQTAVRIPAMIQGMPVREIGGARSTGSIDWDGSDVLSGEGAFMGNRNITSVIIPEGVTVIRARAFGTENSFGGCEKLAQVTLPSTLRVIERQAFKAAKALRSIVIPEGVTEIGPSAFQSCSSLASVTLPDSLVKLGAFAFASGDGHGSDAPVFTSIKLPPNLTKIEQGTFQNCTKLTSIVIPEGVTEIDGPSRYYVNTDDSYAFSGCTALITVNLPSTIVRIGNGAFSGCSSLTTVTIPETVEGLSIHENSFQNCPKLTLASQAAIRRWPYIIIKGAQ